MVEFGTAGATDGQMAGMKPVYLLLAASLYHNDIPALVGGTRVNLRLREVTSTLLSLKANPAVATGHGRQRKQHFLGHRAGGL